jgi:hypothetical protein
MPISHLIISSPPQTHPNSVSVRSLPASMGIVTDHDLYCPGLTLVDSSCSSLICCLVSLPVSARSALTYCIVSPFPFSQPPSIRRTILSLSLASPSSQWPLPSFCFCSCSCFFFSISSARFSLSGYLLAPFLLWTPAVSWRGGGRPYGEQTPCQQSALLTARKLRAG